MASSSSTAPHGGDYEGGEEERKGNNYEVFLSFRGKDTRKGFTDYLYTSLKDAGTYVFRDDNELRVGDEFGPELLRSITQSKISIPIISEGYASSKWCLRELAHMLNCKRNGGQIVLPIFYKVKPSQVRPLAGRLLDAIDAHKMNLDERIVKEWEEALKEVTSLEGWESEKIHNGQEAVLVKMVVRRVMSELKRLFQLNVPEQLVGVDHHVENIMSKIDAKFNSSWIIGIYGMGGIGKTTLAKVLYNKLSRHFEDRSFVENIRETSRREGIKCLQKQLISNIIGSSCDVSTVDEGIGVLKSRFASKKVLILLDDVDDHTHLNALIGDGSWFKARSIVIVTTRDKSILDMVGVSHKYQLHELLSDQSLVLFSRHAFRMDSPPTDYRIISRDIVSTTGGLPLALEVIGSFLCGKTKEAWKATLKKLEKVPHTTVQEKLRISFDALDPEDQQIFLDIACFFIGSSKRHPTYMWDACGFFPGKGIEVLSLLSLIKIDRNGNLSMHDQLRDLGREIIRLENQKEPQNRSRLWIYEEALEVLGSNKGTSKIQGLCLHKIGRSYTAEQFKELTNLRFLCVPGANLIGDFRNLFPQLRWLQWKYCSSYFAAANFYPKRLVVLNLSCSEISEDWGGWDPLKMATELKVLNLANCRSLRSTPDLSVFKNLEILNLENCENLEEIHPSIEEIKSLISLNLKGCVRLKELPTGVGRMKKLKELVLTDTYVQEIPISRGCSMNLETLHVMDCPRLAELPNSIGTLKELKALFARRCVSLVRIPSSIGHLASLSHLDLTQCNELVVLPDSIGSLVSLRDLLLSSCYALREIPNSIGKLTSLTQLHLNSTAIEELPESIGFLKNLKILNAGYCESLACIPSSIGSLASLSLLYLEGCHKLDQLPDSIGSLVSLRNLLLGGCHLLKEIPASIGKLTSLTELDLNSTSIVELPESIGNMQNLKMLDISRTPVIELLGDSGIIAELQELRAAGWENLKGLPDELVSLNKLDLDKKLSELRSRLLTLVHLKRPRIPPANNSAMNCRTVDSQHVLKRSRPFGISDENSESMADVKPRIADESGDKSWIRKLTEINEPWQCRSSRLPDDTTAVRVSRLMYTSSGSAIMALTSNAVHKLWKWQQSDLNLTGRATTSVVPQLWRPPGANFLTNDTSDTNPEEAVPCFALSMNSIYMISTSGGKISAFNIATFKMIHTFMPPSPISTFLAANPQDKNMITIGMEDSSIQIYSGQVDEVQTKLKGHRRIIKGFAFSTLLNVLPSSGADSQMMITFMPPPPAATFLAFYPRTCNIIATGMEDSSILIFIARSETVMANLKGHQKRITGLAFSNVLNVLVSSGADSQLCVWSTDGWEKQASRFLQMPTGRVASPLADTRVQFHVDQIHLLVVHEMQIAIYEAPKLECRVQWVTGEASGPITDATYSCNGQLIYVSFEDGSIGVLNSSTLRFRCRVNPAAYIHPNPSLGVYPLVVAAHPSEPNQFALGLTDGSVYVLEPLESEGEWGTSPPVENGAGPSTSSDAPRSDQRPSPMAGQVGLAQIWARRLCPWLLRPPRPAPCDLGTAVLVRPSKGRNPRQMASSASSTVKKERKKRRSWKFNCAKLG